MNEAIPSEVDKNEYPEILRHCVYNIPLRNTDTPLEWTNFDMAKGLKRHVEKHNIAATWLPRYDTLNCPAYLELLENLDTRQEVGIWFEVTSSHAEAAGVEYEIKPKENWYWAKYCLTMGYSQKDRVKLIDVIMRRFHEVFGHFPKTVSMWMIDSFAACYMVENYGVKAIGLCRNQYGIDGYTMWGGWPNLPYWPSKKYLWQPATSTDDKLDAIVYPLITEDLVTNYGNEYRIWSTEVAIIQQQNVQDWQAMMNDYICRLVEFAIDMKPVGFASCVAENSWRWDMLEEAYDLQMAHISEMCNEGKCQSVTVGDFSDIYKKAFPAISPSQILYQSSGWGNPLPQSQCIMACTKKYRARVRTDADGCGMRLTDLRVYDAARVDPYWDSQATERYARWIIPFLLDSSRFHLTGLTDEPYVDIEKNAPMCLRFCLPPNQNMNNAKLEQVDEKTWQLKSKEMMTEILFFEESIFLKSLLKTASNKFGLELLCNPDVLDMSLEIAGEVYSLVKLPDGWQGSASQICISSSTDIGVGIIVKSCTVGTEMIISKKNVADGMSLIIQPAALTDKFDVEIRPILLK